MFENVLKGTKTRKMAKSQRMHAWGRKDTNRWKKEGSPQNMMKITKKVR